MLTKNHRKNIESYWVIWYDNNIILLDIHNQNYLSHRILQIVEKHIIFNFNLFILLFQILWKKNPMIYEFKFYIIKFINIFYIINIINLKTS